MAVDQLDLFTGKFFTVCGYLYVLKCVLKE